MQLSDEEWRRTLTPEQYRVLREQGTETPFSSELVQEARNGTYACVACGTVLFTSADKYDSHIPGLEGWPSFADVAEAGKVEFKEDTKLGMTRTEVVCKKCGGHLGHVFNGDSDSSTGKHYCINAVCLQFEPKQNEGVS